MTARGIDGVLTDPAQLDEPGFYALVMSFEGRLVAARMADVHWHEDQPWHGWYETRRGQSPASNAESESDTLAPVLVAPETGWRSSLDQHGYEAAVAQVREEIAAGNVYQANICRVLSRPQGAGETFDVDALFDGILRDNPAPYACRIHLEHAELPEPVSIASASPELYLRRDGARIASAPIKGTSTTPETMLEKDRIENVMITDLVRNDVQTVCEPGTVAVEGLLAMEQHPGLVHLVSTVVGQLSSSTRWGDIFRGTFPPGSVSGAPKSSALRIIDELETAPRGPYCGAFGWIHTPSAPQEMARAELAVGIRTFWSAATMSNRATDPVPSVELLFGAGAGITIDSDPAGEWRETELKARKLLQIAQATVTSRRNDERPNLG